MLGQGRRWWPNIKPALAEYRLFAVLILWTNILPSTDITQIGRHSQTI